MSEPRPSPYKADPRPRSPLAGRPCKDETIGCVDGQEMPHGPDSEPARPWSVGQVSIGQGLIELEFGNRFRIGRVEPADLIEREHALGWSASRRQWRGSGGEIEIGEDAADGNGIRNEGDDAHRSTATTLRAVPRADEREDVIDVRDEGGPARGRAATWGDAVRRTGDGLSTELRYGRLLSRTLITPERDDLIPELCIGSQDAVIAVAVDAWRVNE